MLTEVIDAADADQNVVTRREIVLVELSLFLKDVYTKERLLPFAKTGSSTTDLLFAVSVEIITN